MTTASVHCLGTGHPPFEDAPPAAKAKERVREAKPLAPVLPGRGLLVLPPAPLSSQLPNFEKEESLGKRFEGDQHMARALVPVCASFADNPAISPETAQIAALEARDKTSVH